MEKKKHFPDFQKQEALGLVGDFQISEGLFRFFKILYMFLAHRLCTKEGLMQEQA